MQGDKRPNILLITCHDLGRYLHCYGMSTVRSPHLDALADEGVRFSQAFCTAPQCSPSRASIFTGRYPHCNGVMGLTHANFAFDLNPDELHLAQVLQQAGYTTALVGIRHEVRDNALEQVAQRCGMKEAYGGGHGDKVTATALDWLRRHRDDEQPFYLQVGYIEPHRIPARTRREPDYQGFIGDYIQPDRELGTEVPPYLVDDEGAREEVAEIQGAVRFVDQVIGDLLAGLAELGLRENTLVVFTTDHGVAFPRAKCSLYDPGIEVALIMRYPARNWHGTIDGLVSNIDIFPTILDVAGIPIPAAVQGRSLVPMIEGKATGRDAIFGELTYHEYYDPRRCIRTRTHKLIVNFSAAPAFMDPTQSWRPRCKTVVPPEPSLAYHPPLELYELVNDPYEQRNLAGSEAAADIEKQLLASLYQWMTETRDPLLQGPVSSPMHDWGIARLQAAARSV